ncbi:uncharacterized protein LOC122130231 [Clupea harengus]|uniref:Uncharacterized protein LOC122130231 n=1 Tax=Clupea harengus TaxID=7950 RepID=A0A8M1K9U3_CLUHA|nr:uncharacterized protein LOC122130231 [Clupea harengus]
MSMKITEAEHIQNTYIRVEEHIHREVREMPQVLDKLQSTVMRGQTELSEVAQISQSALAAVESTKGMLVQLERQLMTERQVIDGKLNTKHLEKERGVEGRLEREEGDRRISRASNRSKDQVKKVNQPKEDLTDTIDPVGVRVAQKSPTPTNTQQSHMKMVKEMDDLKEALGCTDLQELESRLVSQTATQQQLHTQMKQCEERAAQKQEELAALELQYAQIKFNPGPGCERYEQMQAELCAELEQERLRCREWEAKLRKARAVQQGWSRGQQPLLPHHLPATTAQGGVTELHT